MAIGEVMRRFENQVGQERTLLEGLMYYLAVAYRYRWFVGIVTMVAAAGAVAFSIVSLRLPAEDSPLPNRYSSQVVLLMEPPETDVVAAVQASLDVPAPRIAAGGVDYALMAVRVVKSRYVLDRLATEFGLPERYGYEADQTSRWRAAILGSTDIDYDRATGAVEIRFEDTDPQLAMLVVNRMAELLEAWFAEQSGSSKLRRKRLLEAKLADVRQEMDELEERLKRFQKRYGVLTVEELSAAQTQMLAELRSQLLGKEMQLKNRTAATSIQDPIVVQLRQERDNLYELIRQVERGIDSPGGQLMPAQSELPDLALEIRHVSGELEIQRRIFEALREQYEVAKLDLQAEQPFGVLEWGEVADRKSGPMRGKLCMMVTLAVFGLALAIVFMHNAVLKTTRGRNRAQRAPSLAKSAARYVAVPLPRGTAPDTAMLGPRAADRS